MKLSNIQITVIRKNIKNAHIYVKPPLGNVEVTCPLDYQDESVKLLVISKLGWIKRQREDFKNQRRQPKRQFVSGETIYVLGKQYYLQVNFDAKSYNICTSGDKIFFVVRKGSTLEQRTNVFKEWYRKILKENLEVLIPKWELKTGIKCNGYSIINMQSKWGSCNYAAKRIILNLQLAKKNIECIEYIVLHELAHIIEKTHNDRFIGILDKHMPYWREIRDKLNKQCLENYD